MLKRIFVAGSFFLALGQNSMAQRIDEDRLDRRMVTQVGSLPACNPSNIGLMRAVNDGVDSSDCTTGGGSSYVICECDGSDWIYVGAGAAGGVTDHGALTGLTDDDHARYLDTNADDSFSDTDWKIYANTSPGSDTSVVSIGGGGAIDVARGAYMTLYGEDSAGGGVFRLLSSGTSLPLAENLIWGYGVDATTGGNVQIASLESSGGVSSDIYLRDDEVLIRSDNSDTTLTVGTPNITISSSSGPASFILDDGWDFEMTGSTSGVLTQAVPATVTSYTITWPSAQGGASTVLTNDGAGALSWAAASGMGLWTDGGTGTYLTSTSDNVLIGTATDSFDSRLFVVQDDSSQEVALFKMAAGVSVNPFVIVDSSNSQVFAVDPNGKIYTDVGLDGEGAIDLDYGSPDITDHTFITDGTGDGEIVLPDDSIGLAEIAFDHGDLPGLTDDDHALYLNTTTDDTFSDSDWSINANTSDGSDNAKITIGAGGGTGANGNRGAWMTLAGNQSSGFGDVLIHSGADSTGSAIEIQTNGGPGGNILLQNDDGVTDQLFRINGSGFNAAGASTDTFTLSDGIALVMEGSTSGLLTFEVPATVTAHTLTWPSAQGGASTVLTNDGAGALSWAAASVASYDYARFDAASLYCAESINCAAPYSDTSTPNEHHLLFDDATDEYATAKYWVTDDLDTSGTVEFAFYVRPNTHASANVEMCVEHVANAGGEDKTNAYTDECSGAVAVSATTDVWTEVVFTETVSNLAWAAGDLVRLRVRRETGANDTLTGDLKVYGFRIKVPES